MNELTLAPHADAWQGALMRTASVCANYYAERVPHFIAIGNRIWADQMEFSPLIGHGLNDDWMRAARREIELRGEFTRRMLGALAERSGDVSPSRILVDCTTLAAELIRDGCRDVEKDIERTSRIVHALDKGVVAVALSAAISRVTDHLLDVVEQRADFKR